MAVLLGLKGRSTSTDSAWNNNCSNHRHTDGLLQGCCAKGNSDNDSGDDGHHDTMIMVMMILIMVMMMMMMMRLMTIMMMIRIMVMGQ